MASGTPKIPPGLELAYDLEKGNVHNALDAFVLSLHWSVIRTGLLQRRGNNEYTERLPDNWTQSGGDGGGGGTRTLSLFYYDRHDSKVKYELRIIELTANDMVAVTFFRSKNNANATNEPSTTQEISSEGNRPGSKVASGADKNSAASTFQIGNFVRLDAFGEGRSRDKASDVYEQADQLEKQLYETVMEPMGLRVMGQPPVPGPYDDKTKAKSQQPQGTRDPSMYGEDRYFPELGRRPSPPVGPMPFGPLYVPPVGGPGGLGRSDLDPLGRFGAGNILDPRGFRPRDPGGILPGLPGGIPPGARFDPFGPPNPNRPDPGSRFALPNPDHERPPSSDYDDMFM